MIFLQHECFELAGKTEGRQVVRYLQSKGKETRPLTPAYNNTAKPKELETRVSEGLERMQTFFIVLKSLFDKAAASADKDAAAAASPTPLSAKKRKQAEKWEKFAQLAKEVTEKNNNKMGNNGACDFDGDSTFTIS